MKKEKSKTTRSIGDVINELSRSKEPIPYTLTVRGESFKLFLHPVTSEILSEYQKIVGTANDSEKNAEAMKMIISECVRDEKGNKVWKTPANVEIEGMVASNLYAAILRFIFNLNLSEFAAKN